MGKIFHLHKKKGGEIPVQNEAEVFSHISKKSQFVLKRQQFFLFLRGKFI